MGVPSHAEYSPDGRFVAYDRNAQQGIGDVFVMATDGSRETAIATEPANDRFLGWFPDGRSLLMSSDRSGSSGAWAVPVQDGRVQRAPVLVKPDLGDIKSYGITAAGRFVYALRVGVPDIQVATLDPQTGKATNSASLPQRPASGRSWAAWSPDGKRVIYRIAGTMLLGEQDVTSGTVQTVPMKLNYAERPAWTPDGLAVLVRGSNLNARDGVFRIDMKGAVEPVGGDEQIEGVSGQVIMAPDQSAIFYRRIDASLAGPSVQVLVRRDLPSGGTRDLRVQRDRSISAFALSQDGRFFALRGTHADGTRSFDVMASSGGELRTVLHESEAEAVWGGGRFAWSPDGKYLFVVRGVIDKATGRARLDVWRIAVAGGAPEPVGLTVLGLNGVDVSPDGKHLVLDTLDTTRELWSVQNLTSTLH